MATDYRLRFFGVGNAIKRFQKQSELKQTSELMVQTPVIKLQRSFEGPEFVQ